MAKARGFPRILVNFIHQNIDDLRNKEITRLHEDVKDHRATEQHHFEGLSTQGKAQLSALNALEPRIRQITEWLAAFSKWSEAEARKYGENWKHLDTFLKGWQAHLDKTNAELLKVINYQESKSREKLNQSEDLIRNTTTQLANANRRLLVWLMALSTVSLLLLGAVVYKMFVH